MAVAVEAYKQARRRYTDEERTYIYETVEAWRKNHPGQPMRQVLEQLAEHFDSDVKKLYAVYQGAKAWIGRNKGAEMQDPNFLATSLLQIADTVRELSNELITVKALFEESQRENKELQEENAQLKQFKELVAQVITDMDTALYEDAELERN